ncbi:MAG: dTDP-4-dehydrorhamnose reductase [Sphingobacteriales bacterium]|nr:dTDP-4-dehydrorhamnose reductase [Sphingobacteriales bacterium]
MNKSIVFGASGQLGHCIKIVSEEMGIVDILFPNEKVANILETKLLEELFEKERPAFVINCAAYTAVDKAEDEIELARKINKDGAANLAELCNTYNATLIHVSTDFVFEGNQASPLNETDIVEPINIYGLTKLEGEKSITDTLDRYFILRTSWLYSEYGNNFVKTMLKLGQERPLLNIISDQIGTPTYAIDLASCILNIINSNSTSYGLYHYSNEGATSWYDFAKAIFNISNMPVKILPITSKEYVTKAKRPSFSVMDKSKIKQMMNFEIPYWRDSLEKCLSNIRSTAR